MKKVNMMITTCFFAMITLSATPAHAFFGGGGIVIDPSNLVQNTMTAINAAKIEINTLNGYIQQARATVNLAKSLEKVGNIKSLSNLEASLAGFARLKQTSVQLADTLEKSRALTLGLQAEYGGSNLPWREFLARKAQVDAASGAALAYQYSQLATSMQNISTRRQAILAQLDEVGGQTAALQVVGVQLDTLVSQNQAMATTLAAEGQARQVQKNVDQAAAEQAAAQSLELLKERQRVLKQTTDNFK